MVDIPAIITDSDFVIKIQITESLIGKTYTTKVSNIPNDFAELNISVFLLFLCDE